MSKDSNYSDVCQAKVIVNDTIVKFPLDTGPNTTVIPMSTFIKTLLSTPLSTADKILCDPNRAKLGTVGCVTAILQWQGIQKILTVCVLRDLYQPFYECKAIKSLNIIRRRLDIVNIDFNSNEEFKDLLKSAQPEFIYSLNVVEYYASNIIGSLPAIRSET